MTKARALPRSGDAAAHYLSRNATSGVDQRLDRYLDQPARGAIKIDNQHDQNADGY